MLFAIVVIAVACLAFWLLFFKLKLLRLTPGWGILFSVVVLHLLLVFMIGLRFVTPYSTNATVVQRTIQLIPRLTEPTLVTAVLVEDNTPVKKGQPLFQFDRRPYEYKVKDLEAQLAAAKQNVLVLKADVEVASQNAKAASDLLDFEKHQNKMFATLVEDQVVRREQLLQTETRLGSAQAAFNGAVAELERAKLQYKSDINGVNTSVASLEAQLELARYYLDNTTLLAPEDGRIINLQVRPGMVSGTFRIGGIAALIVDADSYLLATYFQENLKYVRPGQPVEIAFDLFPGQIFAGKVEDVWRASGAGQYLPSDEVPKFAALPPDAPQGQYAVQITMNDYDPARFPIGAQAVTAIYTSGESGAWAALRKISIRARSWFNWIYPFNF